MSGIAWQHVRKELREVAEAVCTPRQLDALRNRAAGYGVEETGRRMGVTKQAASALFDRAAERIRAAMLTVSTTTERGETVG